MRFTLGLTLLCIYFGHTNTFKPESDCRFEDTCQGCLSAHIDCAWCTDMAYDLRYRCLTQKQLLEHGCHQDNIYENEPKLHILKDNALKDFETVDDQAIQVQPQLVYLKLIKSNTKRIKLAYRPARNNPLDLYVLMDLTWTMRDDRDTLIKLGAELAEALRSLTRNYRLGFGSFADKPAMPMIMPHLQENPCAATNAVCDPTYGYLHHLKLTDDIGAFVRSVNESRITGNLDNLEGGLDALMQVLVCTDEIGWQSGARKIVILVTDGFMHFAGDGLLAGITKPNDKQCHLNAKGEYEGSLEYDYPSLEEIYRELLHRKVSVIFAVTKNVLTTYYEISGLMKEISNVEMLRADSSNILELIKKSYASFIKRTQFTDDSPSFIKVEYETDCGSQFSSLQKLNYCNDVAIGQEINFYINITLTDFPKDGVYKHKIRIEESTLNEFMDIEVEIQKPCPCSEEPQPNSEYGRFQCYENGYLHCGMCQCDEGWTGTFCTCATDSTNATTNQMIETFCRQPILDSPDEAGPICSNRGECDCGTCQCLPGYTGKYCECLECDSYCDLERADCNCGKCICKPGWSGPNCDCKEAVDDCIGPNNEICSVRGTCLCGECFCEEPYLGKFCEVATGSENKLCTFYEPCVTCLIEQKLDLGVCENLTEVCSKADTHERFLFAFVSELDAETRCIVRLENKHGMKCDHYFTYKNLGQLENYLVIEVSDCAPVQYGAIVGGVVFLTVLIGLVIVLIIWGCIKRADRLEYARFEEERAKANLYSQSPLYENPIRHYEVPKQLNEVNKNPFLQ